MRRLVGGMPALVLQAEVESGRGLDGNAGAEAAHNSIVLEDTPEIARPPWRCGEPGVGFKVVSVQEADPGAGVNIGPCAGPQVDMWTYPVSVDS